MTSKKLTRGLLFIAHGSNNAAATGEINNLVELLKQNKTTQMPAQIPYLIKVAFLEFAKPDIATAGGELITQGVREIIVLPYFLAAGNHLQIDIPRQLRLLQQQYPKVVIKTIPHIGSAATLPELICGHLSKFM